MRRSPLYAALLLTLCGCHHDLTGVYFGEGKDGDLYAVHLVETSGRAQGHYQHFSVNGVAFNTEEGLIEAQEDEGKLAGTYKSSALVAQTIPISGQGDGNRLAIDGAASLSALHLNLARITDEELTAKIDALKNEAQAARETLRADHIAAERDRQLAHVRDAIEKEQQLADAIDKTIPYLAGVERFWGATTQRMWNALQKQNYMTDVMEKAAAAERIQQAAHIAAEQHERLAATEQNILDSGRQPQIDQATADCAETKRSQPSQTDLQTAKAWENACISLQSAAQTRRNKMDLFKNAILQSEAIWAAERGKQDEIAQEAAHPK